MAEDVVRRYNQAHVDALMYDVLRQLHAERAHRIRNGVLWGNYADEYQSLRFGSHRPRPWRRRKIETVVLPPDGPL